MLKGLSTYIQKTEYSKLASRVMLVGSIGFIALVLLLSLLAVIKFITWGSVIEFSLDALLIVGGLITLPLFWKRGNKRIETTDFVQMRNRVWLIGVAGFLAIVLAGALLGAIDLTNGSTLLFLGLASICVLSGLTGIPMIWKSKGYFEFLPVEGPIAIVIGLLTLIGGLGMGLFLFYVAITGIGIY